MSHDLQKDRDYLFYGLPRFLLEIVVAPFTDSHVVQAFLAKFLLLVVTLAYVLAGWHYVGLPTHDIVVNVVVDGFFHGSMALITCLQMFFAQGNLHVPDAPTSYWLIFVLGALAGLYWIRALLAALLED